MARHKAIGPVALLAFSSLAAWGQVPATLHLNITSHNEMLDEDYVNDTALFTAAAANYAAVLAVVQAHNARWDMQTCSRFVVAALQQQDAWASSGDILETLSNSGVVQIDPRNKTAFGFPAYDLADVAALIDSCGAQASHVMGGFIYYPYANENWTVCQQPVPGNILGKPWDIDIIWGGGSPGHVHDANNFGVWKPLGGTDSISFYTHAPGNHLWLVGNGCSVLLRDSIPVIDTYNEIFTYAQAIADGTWPADRFYCGNIMMNTRDMGPVITAKLDSLLGMLDPLAANGMIVWETISGKLDAFNAWSAATGVASCQWSCEQASTAAVPAIEWPLMELSLSDGMLLVHGPWGPMVMRVMDPLGRSLWQGQVHDGQRISTAPWTGVVIAELRQGLHVKRMRMMVP